MNLVICAEHETIVSFNAKDPTPRHHKLRDETILQELRSRYFFVDCHFNAENLLETPLTFYFLYSQNDAAEGFVLPKLA